MAIISEDLLFFFEDLKENNTKEWFLANRDRYEGHVRNPLLEFIRAFEPQLKGISSYFVASDKKVGGSLFRIHRDVRFSKDKSPYKTQAGVHFRHENAKSAHTPGFYLHLDPTESFVGVGVWRPDGENLLKIRKSIDANQDSWHNLMYESSFRSRFELAGDSLTRAPKGFESDHPLIEDLKRKDFIACAEIETVDICAEDFLDVFEELCRHGIPYMRFLTEAVGEKF